jgi:hypothetical protein
MNKLILAITFCFIFSVNVNAQSKEQKLLTAVEFLKDALLSGDEASLKKITSENLTYGHSSGKMEDKKAFVNSLVSGNSDFVTIKLEEQSSIINGNTAIVRHKLYASTLDNGKSGDVKLGVMLIFIFEKGDWKLLGRQAFKL